MSEETKPGSDPEIPEISADPAPDTQVATPEASDAIEELKAQLAASQAEAKEAKARESRVSQQLQAQAQERDQFRTAAERAQFNETTHALEVQQGRITSLEQAYEQALSIGDYKAVAKVQTELSKAAVRLSQIEDHKQNLERQAQQPRAQQHNDPVEAAIAEHKFSPRTADYLRAHPDALGSQQKRNMLTAAHYKALAEGITAETPEYFASIDDSMGYSQRAAAQESEPTSRAATTRSAVASAPVSRSNPGTQKLSIKSITLTPNQREKARISGLTDVEWAEHYIRMVNSGEITPIH